MANSFPSMIPNEPPPLDQSDDDEDDSGDLRDFGKGLKIDVDATPLSTPVKQPHVPKSNDHELVGVAHESFGGAQNDVETVLSTTELPNLNGLANPEPLAVYPVGLGDPVNSIHSFSSTMKTSYIGSIESNDHCDIDIASANTNPYPFVEAQVNCTIEEREVNKTFDDAIQNQSAGAESEDEFDSFKQYDLEAANEASTLKSKESCMKPLDCDESFADLTSLPDSECANQAPADFCEQFVSKDVGNVLDNLTDSCFAEEEFDNFVVPVHTEVVASSTEQEGEDNCDALIIPNLSKATTSDAIGDAMLDVHGTAGDMENGQDSMLEIMNEDSEPPSQEQFGDFTDFADFSSFSETVPVNSQIFVPVSRESEIQNDLEKFGSVEVSTGVTQLQSDSKATCTISQSSTIPNDEAAQDDFDDDDEFEDFVMAPSVPSQAPAPVKSSSDLTRSTSIDGKSVNIVWSAAQIEGVIKSLFVHDASMETAEPPNITFQPIEKEIKNGGGGPEWQRVQDFEGSQGLLFKWNSSSSYQKLLQSLKIDNTTVVYKSKYGIVEVPRFAASLVDSPLLPESSAKTAEQDRGNAHTTDVPLAGVIRSDNDASTGDCSPSEEPLPAFSPRTELCISGGISAEAERILNQLPDLSYMRAKTLVFPSDNVHGC